jgi:hypothetical protein
MGKATDRSLVDALSWASLRELPEKDNGENIYILALALVTKRDGSKSYVATRKTMDGKDKVVKVFGSTSIIVKIEEVYPYLLLDGNYLPTFEGKKREERIKWLSMSNPDIDYSEFTLKELNREILGVAMKNQLRDMGGNF